MKKLMVSLLIALCVAAVSGCGKSEKEDQKEAKEEMQEQAEQAEEEKEEEKEYQKVGNDTEDAYDILLKNSTGQDITAIRVKTSVMPEWPESMLPAGEVIKGGDTVEFFYTPEAGTPEQDTTADTDKAVNVMYIVHITLADGSMYELNSFGFDDMEEDEDVEICLEDGVAFVKYTSDTGGAEVSTKEQELGIKAQKEAEALAAQQAAEAEAARQAEEARQAEAAKKQQQQKKQQQKKQQKQQAPSQSSDGCLDGVAIN